MKTSDGVVTEKSGFKKNVLCNIQGKVIWHDNEGMEIKELPVERIWVGNHRKCFGVISNDRRN